MIIIILADVFLICPIYHHSRCSPITRQTHSAIQILSYTLIPIAVVTSKRLVALIDKVGCSTNIKRKHRILFIRASPTIKRFSIDAGRISLSDVLKINYPFSQWIESITKLELFLKPNISVIGYSGGCVQIVIYAQEKIV